MAKGGYCFGYHCIAFSFNGQITFGIKTHGTVIEIRRAYPNQRIIDNEYLRMHIHALWIQFWNVRIVNPQLVKAIGGIEPLEQAFTQYIQCVLREPAYSLFRQNNNNLRSLIPAEPSDQSVADLFCCEILVFDIDGFLRRGDRINQKLLDLSYFLLTLVF